MRHNALTRALVRIPARLSNRLVVGVMNLLDLFRRFFPYPEAHEITNCRECEKQRSRLRQTHGYIEDQNLFRHVHYGCVTLAYSGCEVIAVYNALHFLCGDHKPSLHELIHRFEKHGIVLNGRFGSSPRGIMRNLRDLGFQVSVSYDPEQFTSIEKTSDAMLLMFYNNREDITEQIHTICITREGQKLYAHNLTGGCAYGPAASMKELLIRMRGGCAKPLCLIGVCK